MTPQEASQLEGFDAVIAALTIFRKYENPYSPFHCEHDTLHVCVDRLKISQEDTEILNELGFHKDGDYGGFYSFKFGSA